MSSNGREGSSPFRGTKSTNISRDDIQEDYWGSNEIFSCSVQYMNRLVFGFVAQWLERQISNL